MTVTDKPTDETAPSEDTKAKFRAALERKAAAQQRRGDGRQGTGAVQGSETSGPTQRMFRRKSGG
jgi:hypothetical protein